MPYVDPDSADPKLVKKLVETFEASAARLREKIIKPPGKSDRAKEFNHARSSELMAQVNVEIERLKRKATKWTGTAMAKSMAKGIAVADRQAEEAGIKPGKAKGLDGSMGLVDRRAVEVVTRDTVEDLHGAADSMKKNAHVVLRKMAATGVTNEQVNDILAGKHIIEGQPREAVRALRELLRKVHGDKVTITDKNGDPITYDVGYYAHLVATTKAREATTIARHERLLDNGIALVSVIGRSSKNFCSAFLGHVYSIDGDGSKYPLITTLPGGGPPFHPQCSKSTAPFIEELASDAALRNAQPSPEAREIASAQNPQRAFREKRQEGVAKERQRNIVDDIRQRAMEAGYKPPAYGEKSKAQLAEEAAEQRAAQRAQERKARGSEERARRAVDDTISVRKAARTATGGEPIPPSPKGTPAKARRSSSPTTEELQQRLDNLRASNAESRAKLEKLQQSLNLKPSDEPVTVGVTTPAGDIVNVTGVKDQAMRDITVKGVIAAHEFIGGGKLPGAIQDDPTRFKGMNSKDAPAAYAFHTDQIIINPNAGMWKDPKGSMQKAFDKKWSSSSREDHVIIHEFGHWAHRQAVGVERFQQLQRALTPNQRQMVEKEVSIYGASKGTEFVAEVFAGLVAGRKFNDDVMTLYRKFGGPEKK